MSTGSASSSEGSGGKVFAKGRITGRAASGRTTVVPFRQVKRLNKGGYRVTVIARKAGCTVRRSNARRWTFKPPSLPVKALPVSTRINDNVGSVRFALRPVRRSQIGQVRTSLINARGETVAEQVTGNPGSNQVITELPIESKLAAGQYRVRLVGQEKPSGQ